MSEINEWKAGDVLECGGRREVVRWVNESTFYEGVTYVHIGGNQGVPAHVLYADGWRRVIVAADPPAPAPIKVTFRWV